MAREEGLMKSQCSKDLKEVREQATGIFVGKIIPGNKCKGSEVRRY